MRVLGFSFIAFMASSCLATTNAFAFFYGEEDNIHTIHDIEGTDWRLCHKTRAHFFILGIYLTDEGYVLQKQGDNKHHFLLDDEQLSRWQDDGLVTDPLPEYSIPILDYVTGYSLWILVACYWAIAFVFRMILNFFGALRLNRLRKKPDYREALKIALESESNGMNDAVDFLMSKGIPLAKAQRNMEKLLLKGKTISI